MKEQIDKTEFLKARGWFQWYNDNYWCHAQFGSDERDCTNWGMTLDNAYGFETNPEIREKILSGMDLMFNAKKALSNLTMKEQVGVDIELDKEWGCVHCGICKQSRLLCDCVLEEYGRLKRLDENVKKAIQDAKKMPGYFGSIIELLESLDK